MDYTTVDSAKDRVVGTLDGAFDEAKATQVKDELVAAVRTLGPGFDLALDMTDTEFLGKEGAASALEGSKNALAKAGVDRVVRVQGGSSLAAMRVERTGESPYEVLTADSVEEAHVYLDSN